MSYGTYLLVLAGCLLLTDAGAGVEVLFAGLDAHLLSPRPGMLVTKRSEELRLTFGGGRKWRKPEVAEWAFYIA